ncbi:MAG: AAA family ATPase [Acidimicrobiia bacterium]|nr:AAA family ATPase [Acidimicrobiia bacterium]
MTPAEPYVQAVRYFEHGWPGPLPIGKRPRQKTPPPEGYTGNKGAWPTLEQILEWVEAEPRLNIGLRLPANVIGIDVDAYDDKHGAGTLLDIEDHHGRLPATWISTARGDGVSGIRLFRLPPGADQALLKDDLDGIEVIRFGHRYANVWPSVHPQAGGYRWITPEGALNGKIPKPDELAELPEGWYRHISQQCSCYGLKITATSGDPVADVVNKYRKAAGSRHNAARGAVLPLVGFLDQGWPGAAAALDEVHAGFLASIPPEETRERRPEAEWQRLVEGAREKGPGLITPFNSADGSRRANDHDHVNHDDIDPDHDDIDPDLDDFLDAPEPEHDWIIPGLIERGDRCIVTGGEGIGKSTLLRQMSVTTASGIHPFSSDKIDPRRVLLVDCENSRRHIREKMRPLRLTAGERLQRRQLIVIVRPEGLDLHGLEDQRWLTQKVEANRPDLLIIGPLYKLASGDPTAEEPAKAVSALVDRLRTVYGFAVVIEAHSPHGVQGVRGFSRTKRPYGASLWLRWPEFGLHLGDTGQLAHWRGARDERQWPSFLTRGGSWPFTIPFDRHAVLWAKVVAYAGTQLFRPSLRMIEAAIVEPRSTIQRVLDQHSDEWASMFAEEDET